MAITKVFMELRSYPQEEKENSFFEDIFKRDLTIFFFERKLEEQGVKSNSEWGKRLSGPSLACPL